MALSSHMPDLSALEVLLAVAKTASLGAAGRELGLTQQAVSARLTSIEAQTGVQLAVRTPRGTQLTPAGVVVAQWADHLLDTAQQVDAGLSSLRAESRSKLKVAASLTIAEQLMPLWLVSLQAAAARSGLKAPKVILTTTNSEHAISAVRDGTAHLGFIESLGALTALRSRVVAYDELVVVVPAGHKWVRRSKGVSAMELSQTPLVAREPGSGTRDSLTNALRGVLGDDFEQESPALELSSTAAVRAAVLAGAGPAVLSRLAVADDLAVGRLRAVQAPDVDLRRALRAIWSGARTPPAGAIRDLLSHIATISSA
ncbi:LysR family transcriptional regulator [Mycobacterium sp.]|uniref:LysR family transcriptional regulator n=1 Tax=Mycobacterium sp. TaxID=1785 RepID=UPI0031D94872